MKNGGHKVEKFYIQSHPNIIVERTNLNYSSNWDSFGIDSHREPK
jgi:hypothetical protein